MTEQLDDLYTARNLLYLGAYPQALNALSKVHARGAQELEQQSLKHRALLAQGQRTPLPMQPSALQTLGEQLGKPEAAQAVEPLLTKEHLASPVFAAVAAQALWNERPDEALRVLAMHPKSPECLALSVALLLKLNRADLALKSVNGARAWAEDAPLAQLAEAWTGLHVGGEKYTEALYIFEELAQAVAGETPLLMNARAVARMHLGQVEQAEELLLRALGQNAKHADTLANLVVCAGLAGRPAETRAQYLAQLRDAAPDHPFVQDLAAKEAEFDQLAASFSQ
ncbi:hypothetical protein GGI05_000190 [Coemansia sp. RSA 2603]|nr:hypothetical protein GGI05_000190 [Coemansia sp. RSA 2603]